MKNILITGSRGFIGGELTSFFSKKYFIYAATSTKTKSKKKNVKYIQLENLLKTKDIKFEAIIHCGSSTPLNTKENKIIIKNNNYNKNLNKIISQNKVKIFFFLSSMSVYYLKGKKLSEVSSLNKKIKSPYAYSKIKSERLFKIFLKKKKINYLIIRLCTVLGKKSQNSTIPKLIKKIQKKKSIKLNNSNTNYNYSVSINLLIKFLDFYLKKYKKKYDVVNFYNSSELKISKIVKKIKKILNLKTKIEVDKIDLKLPFIKSKKKYKFNNENINTTVKNYLKSL